MTRAGARETVALAAAAVAVTAAWEKTRRFIFDDVDMAVAFLLAPVQPRAAGLMPSGQTTHLKRAPVKVNGSVRISAGRRIARIEAEG